MTWCKRCGNAAAINLPGYSLRLCEEHFFEFMRNRVKKIIRKYKLINPHERVAVALSGGKDSAVLFHLLDSIYSEALDLVGVHVNLGIAPSEYSTDSLKLSREICEGRGREFHCIDLKKHYGITMDMVKEKGRRIKRPLCGICGIFKRYLLNRYSLELNCEKLATGHVLDDEIGVLLMNFFNGHVDQLIRVGPHLEGKEQLMCTRVKPLYEISERMTTMYAHLANLTIQNSECPYSIGASSLKYKNLYLNFENQFPGSGLILLNHFQKKMLEPLQVFYKKSEETLKKCIECGGPTSEILCAFCNIKKILTEAE